MSLHQLGRIAELAGKTGGRALLEEEVVFTADHAANQTANIAADLNIFFLLFGAYLVFFMQCGFALLEAGSVRMKNTKNILLKNLLDACVGGIVWWGFGYPFSYGEGANSNGFIGVDGFFMEGYHSGDPVDAGSQSVNYALWLFQWAFAATAATIVSGAVAERCQFRAYLIYTIILTAFIYPVVVHWGWSSSGWLSAFNTGDTAAEKHIMFDNTNGLIDFAGSGIVHMTGGGAALMAAIFIGPRVGRFGPNGEVNTIPPHSLAFCALGTFILWFGWYAFNPCSTLGLVAGSGDGMLGADGSATTYAYIASKTAVTTTLSACSGGVTTLAMSVLIGKNQPDVAPVLNGILGGLVAITAPCSTVQPYGAFIIGIVGGAVYYGSSALLRKLKIDDPLDASPVHFFCGMWGVLSVGFFATEKDVGRVYGGDKDTVGVFYGGDGAQLGIQIVGILAIASWVLATSGLMFAGLKAAKILRVSPTDEIEGLDNSHHGGSAYNFQEANKLEAQS